MNKTSNVVFFFFNFCIVLLSVIISPFSYKYVKTALSIATHLTLDKIAAISQTIFFWFISVNKKFHILIKIWLKFVPKGPIDNNPALV